MAKVLLIENLGNRKYPFKKMWKQEEILQEIVEKGSTMNLKTSKQQVLIQKSCGNRKFFVRKDVKREDIPPVKILKTGRNSLGRSWERKVLIQESTKTKVLCKENMEIVSTFFRKYVVKENAS